MTFEQREQKGRDEMSASIDEAWTAGRVASRGGHAPETCPYAEPGPQRTYWLRGWEHELLRRQLEAAQAAPHRAALLGAKLVRDCEPLLTEDGRDHLRQVVEELQSGIAPRAAG